MKFLNGVITNLLSKNRTYLYVLLSFALFSGITMLDNPLIILAFAAMFGYIFNKTHSKLAIALAKASEYRTILDSYNNIVLVVDDKKVISANSQCLKFFDIPDDICETELHSQLMDSSIAHILNSKVDHNIEIIGSDGSKKVFSVHPKKLSDVNDAKYMIELADITDHVNEKNKLENKAFTDQLTKLYNRRFFDDYLVKKFKSARKSDTMSFILLDIDNFKSINDTYGHQVGDEVLMFLAGTVQHSIRESDVLCRWGGEEFLIITHTDKAAAIKIAENLRGILDTKSFDHPSIPHFTCSFGISETIQGRPYIESIEESDKMLYKSKRSGKNMVSAVG